jgi:hypothetical protein
MDSINGFTITTASIVTFETRAVHDVGNVYTGNIVGVDVTYRIANTFSDVTAFHADVPALPEEDPKPDVDTLAYFLLQLPDGSIRPFAAYWIATLTFAIVNTNPDTTIIIRRLPAAKIPIIMSWIRAQGFACAVVVSS